MVKGLTIEQLEEMLNMEQKLDIPVKDRFHKTLTEEEMNNLTELKSYASEDTGKVETDMATLEAKLAELKKLV
jgi:Ser-tRNA(Ala) deacylase AlaX